MKKIFLIPIMMTVTFYCYSQSALRLQGIIDFDLTSGGYTGKAIHLFAGTSINDLSQYGIGVANNGNGGDGQEYTFPTISVDDGDHILLARDSSALSSYLGVCYQMFDVIIIASNAIDQNGNDAIELYKDSVVVQTFGDISVDGTGTPWEYLDSWAYQTGLFSSSFNISSWTFGGVECTIGSLTTQSSSCPYPFCTTSNTENNLRDILFNIYPNPSNDIVYLNSEILVDNIRVIDALGKEVNDYSFDNKILNVNALSSGVYFIQIEFNDMLFSQKFFKN